jgi:predicted small lipoprotein YifL
MKILRKTASASLIVLASLAALSGCQRQEGPAERAGKEVDKAVEKVGEQIEKAGDSIEDATKREKKK